MSQAESRADAAFEPLVEINMEIGVFGSNWSHCDHIASYLARMVSHNRTDSLLYSNLFSSAANELLETVFRMHGAAGTFICSVLRHGPVDRIELTVPCEASQAGFYESAVDMVHREDAPERYREALFSTGQIDPNIGLLELAVDYDADLSVEPAGDGLIRLTADLALEDKNQ
ncbi:MAG: ubiquinone biosynthesis methyltransferase UbiE [Pseudomonadota bacterium]